MANLSQAYGTKALYTSSNKYSAVSVWQAGHAYSVGDICRPSGKSTGITFTQANPGVFTWRDNSGSALTHNFLNNERIVFNNNGDTLPTNLAFATTYWVRSPSGSTFNLSATWNGGNIDTTAGSQAGTHIAQANFGGPEQRQLCYICIVAGTSAATNEPVWPATLATTSRGSTVTDGTVTWMEATGIPILNGDATHTPNWTTGSKNDNGFQINGQVILDNAGTHVFICTTNNVAGGTGAEPTWNVAAVGNDTTDSSQNWRYLGTVSSWQARKWAAPFCTLVDGTQSTWGDGSNNGTLNYYVGDSHHEIMDARNWQWNLYSNKGGRDTPMYVTCISESGSIPPGTADLSTGAISETNSSNTFNPFTFCYVYGMELRQQGAATVWIGYNGSITWEKSIFNCAPASGDYYYCYKNVELHNCQFKLGQVDHFIYAQNGTCYWHNDDPSIPGFLSGTVASNNGLFRIGDGGAIIVEGVDLATNQSGTTRLLRGDAGGFGDFTAINCKVPNNTLIDITKFQSDHMPRGRVINCDNGAFFNHCEVVDYRGYMTTDRVAYTATGAAIGGSNFSWKFVPQYSNDGDIWKSLPITAMNTQIASTLTVTLYGCTSGALPTNNEVWLEGTFLGATSSPLATGFTTKGKPSTVDAGTSLTVDSSTNWNGAAAARANTHAYVVGDLLSIASSGSVNRLFYCTVAGTSSGSLPGGYATATDGSTVTDGGATFVAVTRFKIVATLTTHPLTAGPLTAHIRQSSGKTSVATKAYWFDPVLNLS